MVFVRLGEKRLAVAKGEGGGWKGRLGLVDVNYELQEG